MRTEEHGRPKPVEKRLRSPEAERFGAEAFGKGDALSGDGDKHINERRNRA